MHEVTIEICNYFSLQVLWFLKISIIKTPAVLIGHLHFIWVNWRYKCDTFSFNYKKFSLLCDIMSQHLSNNEWNLNWHFDHNFLISIYESAKYKSFRSIVVVNQMLRFYIKRYSDKGRNWVGHKFTLLP